MANMLNNVSIRLMSGGHAFSNSDIETIKRAGSDAVVEFVTYKTVLRPEMGFDAANVKEDLEATGYAVAENEVVVSSTAVNGRVAVMAVSAACIEAIKALGAKVRYTSPLLYGDDILEGSQIALYNNVLYVSVFKNGLHFAEAMTVVSDADILYYLESIHRVYGIYNMYARAIGDVERLRRVCRKCFKTKL
ncbi:MAG: hypothetical protein IKW47_02935 [Alistipes sp.]|nr:hypothetical protein [Alistipes sp.]